MVIIYVFNIIIIILVVMVVMVVVVISSVHRYRTGERRKHNRKGEKNGNGDPSWNN